MMFSIIFQLIKWLICLFRNIKNINTNMGVCPCVQIQRTWNLTSHILHHRESSIWTVFLRGVWKVKEGDVMLGVFPCHGWVAAPAPPHPQTLTEKIQICVTNWMTSFHSRPSPSMPPPPPPAPPFCLFLFYFVLVFFVTLIQFHNHPSTQEFIPKEIRKLIYNSNYF